MGYNNRINSDRRIQYLSDLATDHELAHDLRTAGRQIANGRNDIAHGAVRNNEQLQEARAVLQIMFDTRICNFRYRMRRQYCGDAMALPS